jgi:hypothetical protein
MIHAVRQHILLDEPPDEIIGRLDDVDCTVSRRHFEHADVEVGDADGADHPVSAHPLERLNGGAERLAAARPVEEVDVDVVGVQALERLGELASEFHLRVSGAGGLRGYHRLRTSIAKRSAHDLFRVPVPVGGRGIEETDAQRKRPVDRSDRLPVVRAAPVVAAHGPAAERDRRYLDLCPPDSSSLHDPPPGRSVE